MLALLFLSLAQTPPSRDVAELYAPGEEVYWAFHAAGQKVGEHGLRYEGSDGVAGLESHRFSAWTRILPSAGVPVAQEFACELWTDGGGHPLRHVMEARVGASYSSVTSVFAGDEVHSRVVQGGSERDVDAPQPKDVFVQANNFIGYFELMLALHPPAENGGERQLFSTNVLRSLPYRLRRKEAFSRESEGGTVTGTVWSDSLGEEVHLTDEGRLIELSVPAQRLVIRRTSEPVEPVVIVPPEPTPPDPAIEARDVRVPAGEVVLAGTVTRPKDERRLAKDGKYAAVLFLSGSGPQDRQGRSSGVDLGTGEILDRLTKDGFLVLRVDDRGTGGSTGSFTSAGFEDLVSDARTCVRFLSSLEDVDPERIALIGHSEGAATASILGAELPEIAAIVLMAGPGRPLLEVMMDQNERVLRDAGVEGEELESALAGVRDLLERLSGEADVAPEELPADQRSLLGRRSWLQEHARHDPLATIRRVRCPVLILQGSKDFQVSPTRDAQALERALAEAKHPDHALHVLEGLDHLFKRAPGEESLLADYFVDRPVDPGFLDLLSAWLGERLE